MRPAATTDEVRVAVTIIIRLTMWDARCKGWLYPQFDAAGAPRVPGVHQAMTASLLLDDPTPATTGFPVANGRS